MRHHLVETEVVHEISRVYLHLSQIMQYIDCQSREDASLRVRIVNHVIFPAASPIFLMHTQLLCSPTNIAFSSILATTLWKPEVYKAMSSRCAYFQTILFRPFVESAVVTVKRSCQSSSVQHLESINQTTSFHNVAFNFL